MNSVAPRHLQAIPLLLLAGTCGCAVRHELQRPAAPDAQTARAQAAKRPCDLLQAISEALKPNTGRGQRHGWRVSFEAEACCGDLTKIELRSALVGFTFSPRPDLVDWNFSCGAGVGGPVAMKNGEVHFHYLELVEKDARTLAFDLTPAHRVFDESGKKVDEVMQGCPDIRGFARLDTNCGS